MLRYAMSPGDEFAYGRMSAEVDVRPILSAIAPPTLVLNHTDDHWVPVGHGRELAARIPTSTFVEIPLEGHVPAASEMAIFLDPIEQFVKDAWATDATREPDRVLATVLIMPPHRRVRARRRQNLRHRRAHRSASRSPRRSRRGACLEHRQGSRRRFGARVRGPRRPRAQGDPRGVAALRRRLSLHLGHEHPVVRRGRIREHVHLRRFVDGTLQDQ